MTMYSIPVIKGGKIFKMDFSDDVVKGVPIIILNNYQDRPKMLRMIASGYEFVADKELSGKHMLSDVKAIPWDKIKFRCIKVPKITIKKMSTRKRRMSKDHWKMRNMIDNFEKRRTNEAMNLHKLGYKTDYVDDDDVAENEESSKDDIDFAKFKK